MILGSLSLKCNLSCILQNNILLKGIVTKTWLVKVINETHIEGRSENINIYG